MNNKCLEYRYGKQHTAKFNDWLISFVSFFYMKTSMVQAENDTNSYDASEK